jgi:hypothetical protein
MRRGTKDILTTLAILRARRALVTSQLFFESRIPPRAVLPRSRIRLVRASAPCNFSSAGDLFSSPRSAGRGRERSERVRGRDPKSEPSGKAPSSRPSPRKRGEGAGSRSAEARARRAIFSSGGGLFSSPRCASQAHLRMTRFRVSLALTVVTGFVTYAPYLAQSIGAVRQA